MSLGDDSDMTPMLHLPGASSGPPPRRPRAAATGHVPSGTPSPQPRVLHSEDDLVVLGKRMTGCGRATCHPTSGHVPGAAREVHPTCDRSCCAKAAGLKSVSQCENEAMHQRQPRTWSLRAKDGKLDDWMGHLQTCMEPQHQGVKTCGISQGAKEAVPGS